mmetsp:Transcript_24758/g.39631  ORF Transcript_24758/g.39631 Transcript_24758/m.39631 type:complete len:130 (+) Transcript_24758:765-1154(+)
MALLTQEAKEQIRAGLSCEESSVPARNDRAFLHESIYPLQTYVQSRHARRARHACVKLSCLAPNRSSLIRQTEQAWRSQGGAYARLEPVPGVINNIGEMVNCLLACLLLPWLIAMAGWLDLTMPSIPVS